ncbi:Stf0 family sulfotransferase [Salinimicrobium oceani]|uniref:Sulphotransferase Stf0 domain-containing protein n=1 Tax=Salinimicrobium oceani TaxID=2722702 RepID=A0ABX1D3Y3_9FLAO|nr:Stf0 family sulfotransferase [Salinimicrobium oceani]NJW54047.1 hypothetical protein [Salinimicrobium oceani]
MKLKYTFNSSKYDGRSENQISSYVICSTARSGSTLLARSLLMTDKAGLPHEYFDESNKGDFYKRWKFNSIQEYIEYLKVHRVSKNGYFGFKIHYNQYNSVFEDIPLESFFPNIKYIFITRKDKIMQGISLEKATQTNKWSSEFKAVNTSRFNYSNIKENVDQLKYDEERWLEYFKRNKVKPFIVTYENFIADYKGTVKEILTFLNINEPVKIEDPSILQQRDFSNYYWKLKYIIHNFLEA